MVKSTPELGNSLLCISTRRRVQKRGRLNCRLRYLPRRPRPIFQVIIQVVFNPPLDKLMKTTDKELLIKIRSHLADLHDKWSNDPNHDGHCKSSEGTIELRASYPNWFDADRSKEKYISAKPEIGIGVYSYLFGPSRMHDFSSLEEAWEEIKNWSYTLEN